LELSTKIKIKTSFLSPKVAKSFNKKNRSDFESAYITVLENLRDPKCLPYIPHLYIIPIITIELIPINETEAFLHTHFGNQSVDPQDITKLAFFIPIYLKRLPLKEVNFTIAHEIAHFVQNRGSVDYALENMIPTLGKGREVRIEESEKTAKREYKIFKDRFRKELMDSDKTLGKYKEQLCAGAKFMKQKDFLKYTLGDKFKDLKKMVEKKLRNSGIFRNKKE